VERLDLILEGLKADPAEKYCRAMEGILVEVMAVLVVDMPDTVRDAALIAAAQRIEHYEIAAYGCVRTYARLLGEHEAAGLLQESLRDEGDVDKWLTELAEESINTDASTEVAAA
jgi:ferritin-like metal-binding protein YciE